MLRSQTITSQAIGPATIPLPEFVTGDWWASSSQIARACQTDFTLNSSFSDGTPRMKQAREAKELLRVDPAEKRNVRVALYSHDTVGLGHLRRNLIIAQALAESSLNATTLLITGAHEANFFALPLRSDLLTLPRLQKDESGGYAPGQLDITINELMTLRAESICSALRSFRPDVLIVDKVPTGAFGEMLPALRCMNEQKRTKCVLGIRDVLDDPKTVRVETDKLVTRETIDTFYDEIWVYGDSQVYNPIREYHWEKEVAEKVRFTGYLDQSQRLASVLGSGREKEAPHGGDRHRLIVCTLGGGQDGYAVGKAFVEGLPQEGVQGVLLAGPFMPAEKMNSLRQAAEGRSNLRVLDFVAEADQLISQADRVISMGGYNSVCSILSFAKRALIVPRVSPRQEQWIRAERLQRLGLVDVIHPQKLTSAGLREWITSDLDPPRRAPEVIDMMGLRKIEQFCSELIRQDAQRRTPITREMA